MLFTRELSQRSNLNWHDEAEQLMSLIDRHPYLVNIARSYLINAPTPIGSYRLYSQL